MKKRPTPDQRLMKKWGHVFEYPKCKIHPLIKGAIAEGVKKALRAKPVLFHTDGQVFDVFLIDGEVYSPEEAVKKILGQYSWWKDE